MCTNSNRLSFCCCFSRNDSKKKENTAVVRAFIRILWTFQRFGVCLKRIFTLYLHTKNNKTKTHTHTHTKRSVPHVNVRFNKETRTQTDIIRVSSSWVFLYWSYTHFEFMFLNVYEVNNEAAIRFYVYFQCFILSQCHEIIIFFSIVFLTLANVLNYTHISTQNETWNRKRITKQNKSKRKRNKKNDRVNGRRKKYIHKRMNAYSSARTHTHTHSHQLRLAKTKQQSQSWPNVYKLVRNTTINNIYF